VFRLHIYQELAEYIEEETYRCIECGMLFKSLPELKLHIEQHLFDLSFSSVCILSPIYYFNKLIYSETCLDQYLYIMDKITKIQQKNWYDQKPLYILHLSIMDDFKFVMIPRECIL